MAKRKSKKPEPIPRSRYVLYGTLFAVALGVLPLAVYVRASVDEAARSYLSRVQSQSLRKDSFRVTDAPDWVSKSSLESVLEKLSSSGLSVYDRDAAKVTADAFGSSAWVESVTVSVRRDRIFVDLTFRRPVLSVLVGNLNCYVDAQGVALPPPPQNSPPEEYRKCLWIEGLSPGAIPSVGRPFDDQRVLHAARLSGILSPVKESLGLAAVVSTSQSEDQDGACRLRTRRGSIVEWGDLSMDEEVAQRRLQNLLQYVGRFGGLEQPSGPAYFAFTKSGKLETLPLRAAPAARYTITEGP